jgi:hypothetical protein
VGVVLVLADLVPKVRVDPVAQVAADLKVAVDLAGRPVRNDSLNTP